MAVAVACGGQNNIFDVVAGSTDGDASVMNGMASSTSASSSAGGSSSTSASSTSSASSASSSASSGASSSSSSSASSSSSSSSASSSSSSSSSSSASSSSSSGGATGTTIACAAIGAGGIRATGAVLSEEYWIGFRYTLPSSTTLQNVGLTLGNSANTTPFLAVVRLTGPTDSPDSADLTSPDVVRTAFFAIDGTAPATAVIRVTFPTPLVLTAGSYALVYGYGKFGSTAPGKQVALYDVDDPTRGCSASTGYPMVFQQSTQTLLAQVQLAPNLFVQY